MSIHATDVVAEQLARLVDIAHELGIDGEDVEFRARLASIARLRLMFNEEDTPELVGVS